MNAQRKPNGITDHESHENPYCTMHTQTIIDALFVSV